MKTKLKSWWDHLPPKKTAFFISCFFMSYGMYHISEFWAIQCVMIIMGLYIEYEAQFIYGLSFTVRKIRWYWWLLRAVYIGYIVIYGLSYGIGFFATEFSTQETAMKIVEDNRNNNQARINQLNQLIADTRADMNFERDKNGGTGDKFKQDQIDLQKYNVELDRRLNQPQNETVKINKTTVKDMFAILSKVYFGMSKNLLIVIMFGYGLGMVYLALSLKHMKIDISEIEGETVDNTGSGQTATIPEVITEALPEDAGGLPEDDFDNETKIEPEIIDSIERKPEHILEPLPPPLNTKQKMIIFTKALYDTTELKNFPLRSVKPFEIAAKEAIDQDVKYRECTIFYEQLKEWGAIVTKPGTYTKWEWPLAKTLQYIEEMD